MVSFLKKMLQENHPHLDMKIMENIPDFQETIENREIWRKVGYFKGNQEQHRLNMHLPDSSQNNSKR